MGARGDARSTSTLAGSPPAGMNAPQQPPALPRSNDDDRTTRAEFLVAVVVVAPDCLASTAVAETGPRPANRLVLTQPGGTHGRPRHWREPRGNRAGDVMQRRQHELCKGGGPPASSPPLFVAAARRSSSLTLAAQASPSLSRRRAGAGNLSWLLRTSTRTKYGALGAL